jgi:hypothetical protein
MDQGAELAALDPQEFATAVAESAAARDAIDQVAGERLAETLPGLGRASP